MTPPEDANPVEDHEFVFRRISIVNFQSDARIAVNVAAFRPTAVDTSGLSVFREQFCTVVDVLSTATPEKRNNYYVARLAVADLKAIGLSVTADPQPPVLGHCVIPEMSVLAYKTNKAAIKAYQEELAKLASLGIVHIPSPTVP